MDSTILTSHIPEKVIQDITSNHSVLESSDNSEIVNLHLAVTDRLLKKREESSEKDSSYIKLIRLNLRLGDAISSRDWMKDFESDDIIFQTYLSLLSATEDIELLKSPRKPKSCI
jgi:hypothetical protein